MRFMVVRAVEQDDGFAGLINVAPSSVPADRYERDADPTEPSSLPAGVEGFSVGAGPARYRDRGKTCTVCGLISSRHTVPCATSYAPR